MNSHSPISSERLLNIAEEITGHVRGTRIEDANGGAIVNGDASVHGFTGYDDLDRLQFKAAGTLGPDSLSGILAIERVDEQVAIDLFPDGLDISLYSQANLVCTIGLTDRRRYAFPNTSLLSVSLQTAPYLGGRVRFVCGTNGTNTPPPHLDADQLRSFAVLKEKPGVVTTAAEFISHIANPQNKQHASI